MEQKKLKQKKVNDVQILWTAQLNKMRKRKAKKRPLLPDPKFNDQLVTRFVNMLMWDGKKSTAFKIFYDSLDIIEKKNSSEKSSLEIWKDGLSNIIVWFVCGSIYSYICFKISPEEEMCITLPLFWNVVGLEFVTHMSLWPSTIISCMCTS